MKQAPNDPQRRWFLVDGMVVAAVAQGSKTVHAGTVRSYPQVGAYAMSPLCAQYRKANGEQLKRHRDHGWPMLVRHLGYLFRDYLHGAEPLYGGYMCRHCAAVWSKRAEQDADLELAVIDIPDSPAELR